MNRTERRQQERANSQAEKIKSPRLIVRVEQLVHTSGGKQKKGHGRGNILAVVAVPLHIRPARYKHQYGQGFERVDRIAPEAVTAPIVNAA